MEKVIAALWAPDGESRATFNQRLREELVPELQAAGALHIRLNLRDDAVEPAQSLTQIWQAPQQDAVVQFWVPSSHAMFFGAVDAVLNQYSARHAAWLVIESTIIPNKDHPPVRGERSYGWSQMAFLNFRVDQSHAESIQHWHDHHTNVAIVTQSNFEYAQNLVIRALTPDAPKYDAIVEECFPPEAMSDPAAFFDAVNDSALLEDNIRRMMESCAGFLKFGELDVIPTSQYVIHD